MIVCKCLCVKVCARADRNVLNIFEDFQILFKTNYSVFKIFPNKDNTKLYWFNISFIICQPRILEMNAAIAEVLHGRGGSQQQVNFEWATESPPRKSHFADRILQLWAWGALSAVDVQWLAEACVLDEVCAESTKQLARIGSNGKYPGNCRKQLLTIALPGSAVSCKSVPVRDVPIIDRRLNRLLVCDQAIISPIQVVEMMYKDYRDVFLEVFGLGLLEEFWRSFEDYDPQFVAHPMRRTRNWRTRAIPIILHGDGAKFTCESKNSLMVVSWRPLRNIHFDVGTFLLFGLPKIIKANGDKHGVDSHWKLWSSIVHLFNCMLEGQHPDFDHRGRSWPSGSIEASSSGAIRVGDYFCGVEPCWRFTLSR